MSLGLSHRPGAASVFPLFLLSLQPLLPYRAALRAQWASCPQEGDLDTSRCLESGDEFLDALGIGSLVP